MAPPRGSSIQGGGGGGGTRSRTGGSIRSSVRRSSRSSIQSNMLYASTTEDEPESEAESSIDEHRRKDTEYHQKVQTEQLKKAEAKRALEKKEKELEKQKIAARLALKKKGKRGAVELSSESESESDVDNVKEVRKSPRKVKPQPEVQQVESKLLSRMKRFSQLPKEIWEKRVQRKSKTQPSQEPEGGDAEAPASQSQPRFSDGSKENVEEVETPPPPVADKEDAAATPVPTNSPKTKRVSTAAGSNLLRVSPRKKQPENEKDQRGEDSFVNKALLTSTPYPGGAGAWKNGPSLPDLEMSPVTPQNKEDLVSRKVIHTQKIKTQSQPQSRIPVPLPVKLSEITAPSSSSTPTTSAQQKDAEFADNEETPSSPRRSPRKSAAPPPTAQKNGTFNVTHGFGGGTIRPKVVRTPLNLPSQAQQKNKINDDTSATSSEEASSPDQLPNTSQSQEHATRIIEKRSANVGARLRRSIQAATLAAEDDSSSDEERVIPLPRIRTKSSSSRPRPFDSPTVTTGTGGLLPSRLSKISLPPSRLSQLPKEPQQQTSKMSQQQSQQGGGMVEKNVEGNEDEDEQGATAGAGGGGGVSRTSAIHQSPIGRPEKSGLGLERRSKQHTTTSAPAAESSWSEDEEDAPPENIQEDVDFVAKPRAAPSLKRTRQHLAETDPEKLLSLKTETEPSQKPTRSTRGSAKVAPVPVEPLTTVPSQKGRKGKVVAPPPLLPPSTEVPVVDELSAESDEEIDEPPTQPIQKPVRSTRGTSKAAAVPAEPETKQPSTTAPSQRGRKVVPTPPSSLPTAKIPEVNEPSSESGEEPDPEPKQKSAPGTKASSKAVEAEPRTKQPSITVPLKRKGKVVGPPSPSSGVDKPSSESEDELPVPEKEVLQKPARTTRAAAKAIQAKLKKKEPTETVPLKRGRNKKVVAPPLLPSTTIPAVNQPSFNTDVEQLDPETEPVEKRARKSTGAEATAKAVQVEPKTQEPSVKVPLKSGRKNKVVAPAPPLSSETFDVDADVDNNEVVERENRTPSSSQRQSPLTQRAASSSPRRSPLTQRPTSSSPRRSPLTQRRTSSSPRRSPLTQRPTSSSPRRSPLTQRLTPSSPKSASETEQVVDDEPPKKFFKTKKIIGAKTAASSFKPKPKKKPAVTLPARRRGRTRQQKSSSQTSQKSRRPSGRPSTAGPRIPESPLRARTSTTASPSIPEPYHRGRPITASPLIPESPRRGRPSTTASQPIPESYHRSRISIAQTSRVQPASQPLPGPSSAAASRSITSQSSSLLSMRTKDNRRRSIFEIARANTASSSPPRKKTKKKQVEKTPERYTGSDDFGNYHLLKNENFRKILNEERPDHGLDDKRVDELGIKINHFLEDFFTQHCEETPHPYGFIPFGALKTALDEQCLVEEDCSADALMGEMKKTFPNEDWKKSEGILYPSRYSKNQNNDDYL